MPWNEVTKMELKEEFVLQALKGDANISELCKKFGISRKTGYKYLARYKQDGIFGLHEQSRTRIEQPFKTPAAIEALIVAERKLNPCWGARKLKRVLEDKGYKGIPGATSITRILGRNGLLRDQEETRTTKWNFFEHEKPNDLWQMDFKGHFSIETGRCHPLTILDDHSRFSIALNAYDNERGTTVKRGLIEAFRRYGLPRCINVDNGAPWGTQGLPGLTKLEIWLIRVGVQLTHSRICHPQTNGKDERFHRTLKAEVLQGKFFKDLGETQKVFNEWRHIYNTKRPHEALKMDTPITRYTPSSRGYTERLQEIEYAPNDIVKIVNSSGFINLNNAKYYISEGLVKEPIALRPTLVDGVYEVYYCAQRIKSIDPTMGV